MSTLRQEMATTKTTVVYARVPNEVADALRADAEEFNVPPSTHLRRLLEGRYGVSGVAGKSSRVARKSVHDDLPELED